MLGKKFKYGFVSTSILVSVIAIIIIILTYTVWPTPYRYEHLKLNDNVYPLRINRFTGNAELLDDAGWTALTNETQQK